MKNTKICSITKKEYPDNELSKGENIRDSLVRLIKQDHADFGPDSTINNSLLNEYRKKHLVNLINEEFGELDAMEKEVVSSIEKNEVITSNVELGIQEETTFAQRTADKIASFGGSWTFILSFFGFIILWIIINILFLRNDSFDPYPFILLNLILSCLASIQAPIIMMSQNRKEEKDRMRSENDYKINLKAELEIRLLHEKMDHLILHQNQKMLEIQQLQSEFMEEILSSVKKINN